MPVGRISVALQEGGLGTSLADIRLPAHLGKRVFGLLHLLASRQDFFRLVEPAPFDRALGASDLVGDARLGIGQSRQPRLQFLVFRGLVLEELGEFTIRRIRVFVLEAQNQRLQQLAT